MAICLRAAGGEQTCANQRIVAIVPLMPCYVRCSPANDRTRRFKNDAKGQEQTHAVQHKLQRRACDEGGRATSLSLAISARPCSVSRRSSNQGPRIHLSASG